MEKKNNYLYTKNTDMLQISYKEYVDLMERDEEARRCRELRDQVAANLSNVLGKPLSERPVATPKEPSEAKTPIAPSPEPVAEQAPVAEPVVERPTSKPAAVKTEAPSAKNVKQVVDVPPIKEAIAAHFNGTDESGRIFNIFKQYYTCLNESCGGIVRVTLKDGICSIWNYDAWEEFAFVDILDGRLRIGVNGRYTDALKTLDLCEVPLLLARRHNLACVQVDDLNQTVLDVLVTAFNEIGTTV